MITVDVVQLFMGEEAYQEAAKDGVPRDEVSNGIYFRNENPRLRALRVPRGAVVTLTRIELEEGTDVAAPVPVSLAVVARELERDQNFTPLFWLTVEGGLVQRLEQQYLP